MRHDYNLPATWDGMTDAERCAWYTEERVYRQALQQDTPTARHLRKARRRLKRRMKADSKSVEIQR